MSGARNGLLFATQEARGALFTGYTITLLAGGS